MSYFLSPLPLALVVAAVLTTAVGVLVWRRRSAPGGSALVALALGVAFWELTSALCLGAPTLAVKVGWAKVQYLAIGEVPVAWFLFCVAYGRRDEWLGRSRVALLSVLPAAALLLAVTNEYHHLIWSRIEPVQDEWGFRAVYHHGAAFWVMVAYNYALLLVGSTMLLRTIVRLPRAYSRQSRFLFLGLCVPWIGNILYLTGVSPLPGLDFTPFGFSFAVVLLSWALARLELLDLVPIARDVVVDRMTDAVLVVDGLGRILDANAAAQRLTPGRTRLIGSRASLLPWPSIAGRIEERQEGSWMLPPSETGELKLEAQLLILHGRRGEPAGWLVLLRDVSAQVEALRLREELIALVSHELRTPLTGIAGALRLIAPQSPDLPPAAERMLQLAVRNTERLLRLITDLLDLERLKADSATVNARAVPVEQLLQAVSEEMHPAAVLAEVELEQESSPLFVRADPDRVVQVLVNLVGNALKFSEPGGRVRLSAREEPDGGSVRLTVQDGGRGIDAEDLQRIFEPFEQAQPADRVARQGSGLGLAISRAIVVRHGGRIWAESTPGVGSSFHFTLPIADAAVTQPPAVREAHLSLRGGA
jgi:signal transduction histidine kinase